MALWLQLWEQPFNLKGGGYGFFLKKYSDSHCCRKNILNETKNHTPPPFQVKWSVPETLNFCFVVGLWELRLPGRYHDYVNHSGKFGLISVLLLLSGRLVHLCVCNVVGSFDGIIHFCTCKPVLTWILYSWSCDN